MGVGDACWFDVELLTFRVAQPLGSARGSLWAVLAGQASSV